MQPRAILENEARFLLGSEQIRDPAPYNAILVAIAGSETKFNGIQQLIGVERGALSGSLRTLLELGWIRREIPFGEVLLSPSAALCCDASLLSAQQL